MANSITEDSYQNLRPGMVIGEETKGTNIAETWEITIVETTRVYVKRTNAGTIGTSVVDMNGRPLRKERLIKGNWYYQ